MDKIQFSQKYNIDLTKLGETSDKRQLYSVGYNYPDNNGRFNVSVNNRDKDTFEHSISTLNEFGSNANSPKELKKNKIKAYSSLLALSILGVAVPAYLTRNSKKTVRVISSISGLALGITAGIGAFIASLVPKGYKNAKIAQQTLSTLDIRQEN